MRGTNGGQMPPRGGKGGIMGGGRNGWRGGHRGTIVPMTPGGPGRGSGIGPAGGGGGAGRYMGSGNRFGMHQRPDEMGGSRSPYYQQPKEFPPMYNNVNNGEIPPNYDENVNPQLEISTTTLPTTTTPPPRK